MATPYYRTAAYRSAVAHPYHVCLYRDWADHSPVVVGFQTEAEARSFAAVRHPSAHLATLAAKYGIVADGSRLPFSASRASLAVRVPADLPAHDAAVMVEAHTDATLRAEAVQRMHETVSVYGDWRAQAINARAWEVWDGTYSPADATIRGSLVTWRAWPGDTAADYDTSAERFELSPSGRWHGAARPRLYAAEPVR